jgi:hypothetical protein
MVEARNEEPVANGLRSLEPGRISPDFADCGFPPLASPLVTNVSPVHAQSVETVKRPRAY